MSIANTTPVVLMIDDTQLKMEGKEIDLRVSVVPGQFGEKVVMRLLDSAGMQLSLTELQLKLDVQLFHGKSCQVCK